MTDTKLVAEQRARFEAACYAYYLERHAAGKTEDRNEPVGTPEQMFWKQENGTYGVLMYNASWWGWQTAQAAKTPSSQWHANGETDPHAGRYDKERANLCIGNLTDDELANGAFMNYDRRLSVADMINPTPGQHMPIVWMTAVKDRIRWLSRSLEKALAAQSIAKEFDVRTILLAVVPGDGSGLEVYAKNVADVERVLGDMGQRIENFETLPFETALSELIGKIFPDLDTGDILADAATASKALDAQPLAGIEVAVEVSASQRTDSVLEYIAGATTNADPERDGFAQELALQYGFVYVDGDCEIMAAKTSSFVDLLSAIGFRTSKENALKGQQ